MSQENVELVRILYDAWNTRNMSAFGDVLDPEVIVRHPSGWPEPGPSVGREAAMRQFERLRETWRDDALEPIGDFIERDERVVVRQVWHGAGLGPESNMELTAIYTVRNSRVVFIEYFWDHAEALEAVGLSDG